MNKNSNQLFPLVSLLCKRDFYKPGTVVVSYGTLKNAVDRPPENLVLESAGVSWIVVSWSLFPGDVQTSSEVILVSGGGTERNITLEGNGTSVNVTGLQSGTEYSIRVIAIASDGQTSTPSAVLTASTAVTQGILLLVQVDNFRTIGPRIKYSGTSEERDTMGPMICPL